jgi:inorganic pyrophosphatase
MSKFNEAFWQALDALVCQSQLIIDRPKSTHHPRFPEIVYPVDYGYLKETTSMDGNGIDVWRGTVPSGKVDAIVCTVDLRKKDSEIKILMGCTQQDKRLILEFCNCGKHMKGILISRD